jgi:hypothetical protein
MDETIEDIIDEFTKYIEDDPKITSIIQYKLIDPLIDYFFSRLYPYLLFSSIIFLLFFFGLIGVLIFLVKFKIL